MYQESHLMHQIEGDKKCGNFSLLELGAPHATETRTTRATNYCYNANFQQMIIFFLNATDYQIRLFKFRWKNIGRKVILALPFPASLQ